MISSGLFDELLVCLFDVCFRVRFRFRFRFSFSVSFSVSVSVSVSVSFCRLDRRLVSRLVVALASQAASVFTTAIVTGRSKDKVYNFVGLDDVFYAGSHGLEIQGPLDRPVKCQVSEPKKIFV